MKALISQNIVIKDWPLLHPGDKKFFGYVVAIGVFPREWGDDDGLIPYVDFAYNDSYERFLLPDNDRLREQLLDMLNSNLQCTSGSGGIYGKVWILRGVSEYVVELP